MILLVVTRETRGSSGWQPIGSSGWQPTEATTYSKLEATVSATIYHKAV